MRDVKIKKYLKKFDYSYAMGNLSTLEILKAKPDKIHKVVFTTFADKFDDTKLIKTLCSENKINFEINDHLIEKVAFRKNTYVLTIFEKYDDKLLKGESQLILVNPSDAGNVGTIIRAMYAFDVLNLALIKPAIDIFDPKVISTTTGALFRIKVEYFDSFTDYESRFSDLTFYPFVLDGKNSLTEIKFSRPFGMIFGNETEGLDDHFSTFKNSVVIPHSKNIDSLNLAMSAGIALYKVYSQ